MLCLVSNHFGGEQNIAIGCCSSEIELGGIVAQRWKCNATLHRPTDALARRRTTVDIAGSMLPVTVPTLGKRLKVGNYGASRRAARVAATAAGASRGAGGPSGPGGPGAACGPGRPAGSRPSIARGTGCVRCAGSGTRVTGAAAA